MAYQLVRSHPVIPLTKEAYAAAEAKFAKLKQEKKETQQRLNEAREQGDLSENGAYKYAKIELGSLNRQLREVRHLLENGVVTEKTTDTSTVQFGHTVTIADEKGEQTFTLVTHHESDPLEGKLSVESPIGAALVGKRVGEVARISLPSGETHYTIISIS